MSVVQLANKRFSIGFQEADNLRRIAHFRDGSASLTADEFALLAALGIDTGMVLSLRPQLAEFFQSLEHCRNDTSLTLSSACELPYFIIWSVLFANRRETQRRILEDAASHREVGALGDASLSALVRELTPAPSQASLSALVRELTPAPSQAYNDIFTLIPAGRSLPSSRRNSTTTISDYDSVFTLIPAGNTVEY
jgi:hypothetical protein